MHRLQAQNVVTDWNTIASTTIVTNGGKASVASGVWFAYTSIAVYDAVNAVHRMYQPFYYNGIAPVGASEQAAAVARSSSAGQLFPSAAGGPRRCVYQVAKCDYRLCPGKGRRNCHGRGRGSYIDCRCRAVV